MAVQAPGSVLVSIVDPDPFVRAATSSLMRSLGWEACTFASASEFLATGMAARTNCLVCDVNREQEQGIDLLAQLQQRGQGLPTIFITAMLSDAMRHRALQLGALCVIDKPLDAVELEGWVRLGVAAR